MAGVAVMVAEAVGVVVVLGAVLAGVVVVAAVVVGELRVVVVVAAAQTRRKCSARTAAVSSLRSSSQRTLRRTKGALPRRALRLPQPRRQEQHPPRALPLQLVRGASPQRARVLRLVPPVRLVSRQPLSPTPFYPSPLSRPLQLLVSLAHRPLLPSSVGRPFRESRMEPQLRSL